MKKSLLLLTLCIGFVATLCGAPGEWKEDLATLTDKQLPVNWTFHKVALSKEPDAQPATAVVKKGEDGIPYVSIAAGKNTLVHFFFNDLLPVTAGAEAFEMTFQARGRISTMNAGCYFFADKKWHGYKDMARYPLHPTNWKEFTVRIPVPAMHRNKVVTEVRPLFICFKENAFEIRNIQWKIVAVENK